MSVPGGYAALENTREVVVDQAEKSGRDEPDRANWRVLSIMHLADTRDQAIDDCTYGLQDFANYFGAAGFVPLSNSVEGTQSPREFVAEYAGKATAASAHRAMRSPTSRTCWTPRADSGHLLLLGHDWASPQATYHILRVVRPRGHAAFQRSADRRRGPHTTGPRECATNCSAVPEKPSSRRSTSTRMNSSWSREQ